MTHTAPTRTYHYFLTYHTRNISYPLTLYATDVTIYTCLHRKKERGNARYGRKNLYDTRTGGTLSIGRRDDQAIHQAGETRSLSVWGHLSRDAKCVGSVSRNQKAQQDTKIAGLDQQRNVLASRRFQSLRGNLLRNRPTTVCAYCTWFFRRLQGTDGERHVQTMTTRLFTHPTSLTLAPFARQTGGAA